MRETRPVSLDAVWQAFLQSVKAEKISMASYLAEGEPWGVEEGVATIAFPARLNFFKETLEVADNKRLIEKHLGKILGRDVRIQFETLREIKDGRNEEGASVKAANAPSVPPEENPAIKSAMDIFGGRIIQ